MKKTSNANLALSLAYQIHKKYNYLPASVVYTVAGLVVSSDEFTSETTSDVFEAVSVLKPVGFDKFININLSNLYGMAREYEMEDNDEDF